MNVWYDLDGVLFDFDQHFLKWFNLPMHPAESWEDKRFTENMWKVQNYELFWKSIPPLFDPRGLDMKVTGYCTARDCSTEIILKSLFDNHFPAAMVANVGLTGSKGEVLKANGCDIFVDDAIHNFEDCHKQGIECYLMTRSHNKDYDVGKFRVNNIHEFLEKIK